MPSRSGQNGITCMSPTAPLEETAQRSKRLSIVITAITSPGARRGRSPGRWVSQYTCLIISIRSAASLTSGRSRGSISLYQTAESYWSVKHSAWEIACATTACSCGSRCWSAPAAPASIRASAANRAPGSAAARCTAGYSAAEAPAHEGECLVQGKLGAGAVTARAVFEPARLQAALGHHQAVRDAEELGVGELDARAGVAVVVQHLDAGGSELGVQPVGDFTDTGGLLQVESNKDELEGRDRIRPDDAALIVILLDSRGHDARHTYAVAAHVERGLAAGLIEHQRLHGLAVLPAELEDMADLDATGELQSSLAGRARVAFHDVAQVGGRDLLHVAVPVHAGEVLVVRVRAADEIGERERAVIGVHAALEADRTHRARVGGGRRAYPLGARHPQGAKDAGELLRLDGVQLVVAAQHQRHDLIVLTVDDQGLHAARRLDPEDLRQLRDGAHARGRHAAQRLVRSGPRAGRRHRRGGLETRGVIVAVGEHDRILAGRREHVELLRDVAADRPGVGAHRAEGESGASEDAGVGVVHGAIALAQRLLVEVEGVGVLHDEFARAHDAEARPHLVAELGLDLVEIHRQLAVAPELAPRDVGDHLLMGRAGDEIALVAVLDAQQLRSVLGPAPRLLPQLRRLDHRHHQLERPGAVHLLADDAFDFLQRAQAHGQPAVKSGREPPDEPRAQHQLVADDLSLCGGLLGGVDRVLRQPHAGTGLWG